MVNELHSSVFDRGEIWPSLYDPTPEAVNVDSFRCLPCPGSAIGISLQRCAAAIINHQTQGLFQEQMHDNDVAII